MTFILKVYIHLPAQFYQFENSATVLIYFNSIFCSTKWAWM